jgi:hypothetical protein
MFGKVVVSVALLGAICNLVVAGEARHPVMSAAARLETRSQLRTRGSGVSTWMRAWPPELKSRQRPAAHPARAGRGRRLDGAFMVDTSVVFGPASGYGYSYGAASNGDGWRVLWANDNNYSIRSTGISTDGSLLEPQGVPAGSYDYMSSMQFQCIAGTGDGFMAVWPVGDYGIRGATLDSSGAVIDSFLVFESDSGQAEPTIAFDGDSTCLVAWTESPYGDPDVYAVRVTTSGRVLDPTPIQIAEDPLVAEQMPSVAFGQGIYLVAWTTDELAGARAIRVSRQGAVLDTAIYLRHDQGAYQAYPTVAFGDTCFLASWAEGLQQPDMFAARVSASTGMLIDTAGIQLSNSPEMDLLTSVGFDGADYLVVWHAIDTSSYAFSLRARRVTAAGVPLDTNPILPHVTGYVCLYPHVAADQASFLLAFTTQDTVLYNSYVGCLRISPGGVVLDSGTLFPSGADAQSSPSGASDGTDYLAAWLESRATGSAVSAARIAANGQVLDPAGFAVSEMPGQKAGVATAFGDSLYLVAWEDYRDTTGPDIYCARVTRDGTVLDPAGIIVCNKSLYQQRPDVGFDGVNFLVAWYDYRSGNDGDIYAARVSPAGTVLDPGGFPIEASSIYEDDLPTVCFIGPDYLVAWQAIDLMQWQVHIYGALVSPAGSVTRSRFFVCDDPAGQMNPSAASGASEALVAWEDSRLSGSDIFATRVAADGTVLDTDGLLVAATDYYEQTPHVVPDEAGFRVVWRRDEFTDTAHFAAARVDTAGNVFRVGDWFGLAGGDNGFDAVYGSGPDLLLLFSCWTDTASGREYDAYRLWARLDDVPGIAETPSAELRVPNGGATIIRGVLFLPKSPSSSPSGLLDISGRSVMTLKPGANDVSRLAQGVYFLRAWSGTKDEGSGKTRKIVVQR